jgi:light-regulated signal transduction histidine kinase (bacteriophytochrome)
MFSALYGGFRPALLATLLSALLANYFWIGRPGTFNVPAPPESLTLVIFTLSGALIGWITDQIHKARQRAAAAETEAVLAAERERAGQEMMAGQNEYAAKLEALNKELESFNYSVSHDLRAPLRAIDGYARMILKAQGDSFDEKTRRQFDVIRHNVRKMGQLIDDLLTLSRIGRQEVAWSNLDLADLNRAAWEELKEINPDCAIAFTIGPVPPACGDPRLIKQVLVNLLSNAIKFAGNREDAAVEVAGYRSGSENVYYVRDNGIGFDMAYHDKLFGIFQRLHNEGEYEGTGVGLCIVQRIIDRHGGRVWAEGRIDEGATFYFTLAPPAG